MAGACLLGVAGIVTQRLANVGQVIGFNGACLLVLMGVHALLQQQRQRHTRLSAELGRRHARHQRQLAHDQALVRVTPLHHAWARQHAQVADRLTAFQQAHPDGHLLRQDLRELLLLRIQARQTARRPRVG